MSSLLPIGVLTRDRPAYLAATLHSLSGTQVPHTIFTVFDDASEDALTRELLYTSEPVELPRMYLPDPAVDGGVLRSLPEKIQGLASRVRVVRLSGNPLGVVGASCLAILSLARDYPSAPGVVLLQDDIIFKKDWLLRMRAAAADPAYGLLSGLHINRRYTQADLKKPIMATTGATAQCLYVSRPAIRALASWLSEPGDSRKQFDDLIRFRTQAAGFKVGLLNPFCCQHFGQASLVRPERTWKWLSQEGRIGYYVRPPFAWAGFIDLRGAQ